MTDKIEYIYKDSALQQIIKRDKLFPLDNVNVFHNDFLDINEEAISLNIKVKKNKNFMSLDGYNFVIFYHYEYNEGAYTPIVYDEYK